MSKKIMSEAEKSAVVLFDGVCNFCNSSINFIIEHDKKNYFKFAPLQSEIGQKLLKEYNLDSPNIDSVILIEDSKAFTYSTAAFATCCFNSSCVYAIYLNPYIFFIIANFGEYCGKFGLIAEI